MPDALCKHGIRFFGELSFRKRKVCCYVKNMSLAKKQK